MKEPTVNELFDLSGKVALLTGASGWLGRAFAEAGASVIATSRDLHTALEVAAKLPIPGGNAHHGMALDQLDEQSINAGLDPALAAAGQIDILVNNGDAATPAILPKSQLKSSPPCKKTPQATFFLPGICVITWSNAKPRAA